MSGDVQFRFVKFLTLSCMVVSILALAIVMTPSVMSAPSDANSTTSSAVPLEPTEERVNPVTTIVESTTFEVKPLEIPATKVDSTTTPTTPWPYIPITAGAIVFAAVALAALALRRRGHKFSRLRLLSSLLLISLLTITVSAIPVYGQELTVTTWDLNGTGVLPHFARDSVDSAGNVWFGSGAQVGYLNPATNEIKTWLVPAAGSIYAGSVDSANLVWFLDAGNNRIGRLNPSTNFFTIWPIPTPSSGPLHISFDSAGNVYFTEIYANKIGRLNPTTNEITEWTIPTSNSMPFDIMVDSAGSVWFVERSGNRIAKLNPATDEITEWPIPTSASVPSGLYIANGQVYFAEKGGGKIGRLNPGANQITEWYVGGGLFGLFVDSKGNAWAVPTHPVTLYRIGPDNILTYWKYSNDLSDEWFGIAVDRKVNPGDIYVLIYSQQYAWTSPYAWRILRFRTAAA